MGPCLLVGSEVKEVRADLVYRMPLPSEMTPFGEW